MTANSQPSLFAPAREEPRAVFSSCGRYRYALTRVWGDRTKRCLFVMLNPSTADENHNDPTIRRCIGYARSWGHGALDVVNIFAWRSTDPKALYGIADPIGPENDHWIAEYAKRASVIVCAWGNHGASLGGRGDVVVTALQRSGFEPMCLGFTSIGAPLHPLYQPKDAKLVPAIGWEG